MSEPAKVTSIAKAPLMQVRIFGRVEEVRRTDETTITRILVPAADAYSQPSVIEVRSSKRFASKGEEVECTAALRGFKGKVFEVKDKETGEIRKAQSVVHLVELVEEE